MANIAIEFIDVSKDFHNVDYNAVNHLNLTIEEGEFVTILGSSGCGKTTLLKMINRLVEPSSGTIKLYGEDITKKDLVKLRRGIGYVIQQVGLFPHMTISDNIATIPKLMKWRKEETDARVNELLTLVGLEPEVFKPRYPSELSGGQQQRVGLARALAVDPKVMLLDEPFGAIDAITRQNLQEELLGIHKGLKKTFILVTHDINEAFKLGTKVMIMNEGNIRQYDTPYHIIKNPADDFVASLIASSRNQKLFWEVD